jgi:hypothetical protein
MKNGMQVYNDNVLKEKITALFFPSFKHGDGFQWLVASMPDDQAVREWELHTSEDMRWNDNQEWSITSWSREIMKIMRCLMRQQAYTNHRIYAPLHCCYCDMPPQTLCTEIHTAGWLWESQVHRDTRG